MVADLHIHSTYSDGSFRPEEIINMAVDKGFSTIAIADHDTVEAISYAEKAAKTKDIEVIPAIELSTFREKAEIHILGYFIDYNNENLLRETEKIYSARKDRAKKMVKLLNKEGIKISFDQVKEMADDDYIGRPHIARAMIEAGYISEIGDAFTEDYIANGGKAYVPKYKLSPEKAIELITDAGGVAVLAHPIFINHGEPMGYKEIKGLKDKGLKGVEVYHTKHDSQAIKKYREIANDLDLLITGGSDFHGENAPGVEIGDIKLQEKYLKKLKEFASKNL